MKIIKEAASENAYMIRNDGKVFKMLQHVYGSKEEIEETLSAAEWLCTATAKNSTKNLIFDLIKSWGYTFSQDEDVIDTILRIIDSRPYRFLTKKFINDNAENINNARIHDDVDALNDLVVAELNQEFLRARYGGMYYSFVGNKEMIFRVSSIGFNWFNIIFNFVYENKSRISSVTIVKDEESTGHDEVYSHAGKKLYQIPVDEFIMLPGNPIIESINVKPSVMTRLESGMSILESVGSNINLRRLVANYERNLYQYFNETEEL